MLRWPCSSCDLEVVKLFSLSKGNEIRSGWRITGERLRSAKDGGNKQGQETSRCIFGQKQVRAGLTPNDRNKNILLLRPVEHIRDYRNGADWLSFTERRIFIIVPLTHSSPLNAFVMVISQEEAGRRGVYSPQELYTFPATQLRGSSTLKVNIRNSSSDMHEVRHCKFAFDCFFRVQLMLQCRCKRVQHQQGNKQDFYLVFR